MIIYLTTKLMRHEYFFYNLSAKKLTFNFKNNVLRGPPICCPVLLKHRLVQAAHRSDRQRSGKAMLLCG